MARARRTTAAKASTVRDWVGVSCALAWRGNGSAAEGEREGQARKENQGDRETGTAAALEIWTPGGVTVTRRGTGAMGTEWTDYGTHYQLHILVLLFEAFEKLLVE
jgi:hypothetical protein